MKRVLVTLLVIIPLSGCAAWSGLQTAMQDLGCGLHPERDNPSYQPSPACAEYEARRLSEPKTYPVDPAPVISAVPVKGAHHDRTL